MLVSDPPIHNRLRKLVHTIRLSWPHVKNLAMLMFLTFFVFAVCAMKLLGSIPLDTPGLQIIGEWNNFGTFRMAMMLLFQVTTEETLFLPSDDSPKTNDFLCEEASSFI